MFCFMASLFCMLYRLSNFMSEISRNINSIHVIFFISYKSNLIMIMLIICVITFIGEFNFIIKIFNLLFIFKTISDI